MGIWIISIGGMRLGLRDLLCIILFFSVRIYGYMGSYLFSFEIVFIAF